MYIIWQSKAELYHKWWLRQGFIEWNFKVCWFSSFWHFETDAIWCFWIFSEHMRWMTWILACWCILTTLLIFLILEAVWPCETGQIMGFRTYSWERIGGITSYVTCWHTGITFKIDFLFVLACWFSYHVRTLATCRSEWRISSAVPNWFLDLRVICCPVTQQSGQEWKKLFRVWCKIPKCFISGANVIGHDLPGNLINMPPRDKCNRTAYLVHVSILWCHRRKYIYLKDFNGSVKRSQTPIIIVAKNICIYINSLISFDFVVHSCSVYNLHRQVMNGTMYVRTIQLSLQHLEQLSPTMQVIIDLARWKTEMLNIRRARHVDVIQNKTFLVWII